MTSVIEKNQIYIDETEIKPNKYAVNVLSGLVAVVLIVFALNETGVFEVNKLFLRISLLISLAIFLLLQIIIHSKKLVSSPVSKYIIMVSVILLIMATTIMLSAYAAMAFVFPIIIATQYRSYRISVMALVGSCVCSVISPVLAYVWKTYSLIYLEGYMEAVCDVSVITYGTSGMSTYDAIYRIVLYLALPQVLIIGAFGLILMSVTKSGIDNVNNQIHILKLSNNLNEQFESILLIQERIIGSMSDIIESRDNETGGHVRRTSEVVRMMMDAMRSDPDSGVTEVFCNNVIKAAPMHDLGKIAIADEILRKPGKLTDYESEALKLHPVKSAEIINRVLTGIEDEELLKTAKNLAKYHHERIDGMGYPDHLKGKEIPLEARIMAIADVYDALVSERCYKAPMSCEDAFNTIEDAMGTQFDPDLNKYFISCKAKIEQYYCQ